MKGIFDKFDPKKHIINEQDIDKRKCRCGMSWERCTIYRDKDWYSGFMTCTEGYYCRTCGFTIIAAQYRVPPDYFDPPNDE